MGLPKGVPDIGKSEEYVKNPDVREAGSPSHEAKLEQEGKPPVLSFEIPGKYSNPGGVPIAGHENPGHHEGYKTLSEATKAKNINGV
jgi:hypothetical protein